MRGETDTEIKTIWRNSASEFDDAVNAALADGWRLATRKLVQTPAGTKDYLYAELVKLSEVEEHKQITWQDAVRIIVGTCMDPTHGCNASCPMHKWCDANIPDIAGAIPPSDWSDPEVESDG